MTTTRCSKQYILIVPAIHHIHFDHEKLRDLLHSHNGKFILSYNDCEWVRENYKGFKFKTPGGRIRMVKEKLVSVRINKTMTQRNHTRY